MQAILLDEVEGLGTPGTVVNVARGYMRNYLQPRGLAEAATPARIAEVRRREADRVEAERKAVEQARELSDLLGRTILTLKAKAGDDGRLLRVGQEIEKMVVQREGETSQMVQGAETLVYELSQKGVRGDFTRAKELVIGGLERLTRAAEGPDGVLGVPTGFIDIDGVIGGLQPGNLIVIAARPSMGKTALALCMAEHAALNDDRSVALFSLEMSGDELIQRMLSSTAVVDAGRIRSGRLAPEDWSRIGRAADRLSAARLFIDDSEGVSLGEMRTKCRRLKSRDGLDLLIVDYIQLMEGGTGRREESRVQEISAISRGLKMLARDLEVPLIVLSQLNRSPDARNDKRPMLSDLRESGAIEQDADLVLMIYRDEYYNPESEDTGVAEVIVAKNRHGPTDRVKLTFRGSYAKFDNLMREE
ncbi:MAG: replicative DNA helicase [Miltoncostaeaceae bacterium]